MKRTAKISQLCSLFLLIIVLGQYCQAFSYMDEDDRYPQNDDDIMEMDHDTYEGLPPEEDDWTDMYDSEDEDSYLN